MPRFDSYSWPSSATRSAPHIDFYREEILKHQRCLERQREFYSERAVTGVETALSRLLAHLDDLCRQQDADQLFSRLLRKIDVRHGVVSLVRHEEGELTDPLRPPPAGLPHHLPGSRRGCRCRALASSARCPAKAHRSRSARGVAASSRQGRPGPRWPPRSRAWRQLAVREAMVVGPRDAAEPPAGFERFLGGHPVPDEGERRRRPSRAGDRCRHEQATSCLVVLLSGGASALLAAAGRGAAPGRETRDHGQAAEGGRRHPRAEHRAEAPVARQGWLARRGGARTLADARRLGRRRRRPERHRVGTDSPRSDDVCGRARG